MIYQTNIYREIRPLESYIEKTFLTADIIRKTEDMLLSLQYLGICKFPIRKLVFDLAHFNHRYYLLPIDGNAMFTVFGCDHRSEIGESLQRYPDNRVVVWYRTSGVCQFYIPPRTRTGAHIRVDRHDFALSSPVTTQRKSKTPLTELEGCLKLSKWIVYIFSDMPKSLFLPIGVSGCGKTSLRRFLLKVSEDLDYISKDEIRYSMLDFGNTNEQYDESIEDDVLKEALSKLDHLMAQEIPIYWDATNRKVVQRAPVIRKAREEGYKIIGIRFITSYEECLKRNKTRSTKIPEDCLIRQWEEKEPLEQNECDVILAIDGTDLKWRV